MRIGQNLADRALFYPLEAVNIKEYLKLQNMLRALSQAMSYGKAVLLSEGIILGKNEKTFLADGTFLCLCQNLGIILIYFLYTWLHKLCIKVPIQTSQTQKTARNLNLWQSNGCFEGLADGKKIVAQNTWKSKTPDKNQIHQSDIFIYLKTVYCRTYCTKDLLVKLILDLKNKLKYKWKSCTFLKISGVFVFECENFKTQKGAQRRSINCFLYRRKIPLMIRFYHIQISAC